MAEATVPVSSRAHRARDRALIGVVVACGAIITAVSTRLAWEHRAAVFERGLSRAAHEIQHSLGRQIGGVEAFVETVGAFVESSEVVTRAEFDSFLGRTAHRWPGLVALEWQAWVPGARLAEFEARMQTEAPGYRVVERDGRGEFVPARPRDVHVPIVYAFSAGVATAQPGLDTAANQEWLQAKVASIETSTAVASPSFGIIAADGRGIGEGFAVNDAVLAPGVAPARERVRGVVTAVFAYKPMIDAALAGTRVQHVKVTVRDTGDVAPAYFSWPVTESETQPAASMQVRSTLAVAGRAWEISVSPGRDLYSGVVVSLPWTVGAAGVLVTLACALVLAWRQRVRNERETQILERLGIERRFRDIVDRMAGAVFVMRCTRGGARFEVVEVNAAAARLAGRAVEAVLGREFAEVLPGAADAGLLGALERVCSSGEVQRIEVAELVQAGASRHLDAVFFRVGQGDEICVVLHDLTELKEAEGALREARDELELALDVSRVGLWSWEMAANRVRLDSRCARLFGRGGSEYVDASVLTERVHPEDLKVIRDEVDRAVRESRGYEVEYRYTMPDGTLRYLCSRARPVRERSGAMKIVGCSWDVTERRRMEEHLRRTQRLESLGTLAGGVAHDLNNALAPVTMGLDLLKRRLAGDEESVESVKLMQTSVRRASSIVRQLIAFKRGAGESKQQAPAHPKRILEMLGTTLVESFPKEISVLVEPASLDLPRIVADEREAHQVLLNLCVNARDAMPAGGKLVVSCEGLELSAATQAQHPELRTGSYVVFSVSDTGTGISPDIRHRVFDPFFTTKEVGKGSGLGLSTALGIVKAHRGSIQFDSKEGVGTTFRVFLPALADDEPARTVTVAARPVAQGEEPRPPRLLLVDDEAQVRELSRRALEQSGFKVMTAGNGREAVELFSQNVADIDAVVMDLLMPVMNGAAATAAIKRIRPDVPIVGASGFATDALVEEAKNAGITTFLPKPFTVSILVDAVRAAMAQKPAQAASTRSTS